MGQSASVCVGIEVSKGRLDLAFEGGEGVSRFANDPGGYAAVLQRPRSQSVRCVVVEATGGYERPGVAGLLLGAHGAPDFLTTG